MASETRIAGVDYLSLPDALELGHSTWDEVQGRSPFMSWAWHRAWTDTAPESETREASVLALRAGDGTIKGLLPLRLCRAQFRRVDTPTLTWAIGDTGCPDDLDVPLLPTADVSPLAAALDETPWVLLILSNLAPGAPNAARLRNALQALGHATRLRPLWSCPQLTTLPPSWDAYLASLSANRRQVIRRKERALRRAHAVTLSDYGADRLDEGWKHLMDLHERRWSDNGGGAFQDTRAERLQRLFASEMARQGRLWLTTLDLDGRPAAAWYGFESADTVYFYQGGRDPGLARESVGLVLMSLMIQRAIERGFRNFNFLRGDDPYKRQWTDVPRMTEELVVFRSGWRGRCLRALDSLGQARRKLAYV